MLKKPPVVLVGLLFAAGGIVPGMKPVWAKAGCREPPGSAAGTDLGATGQVVDKEVPEEESEEVVQLEPVVVTSTRVSKLLLEVPAAVGVVEIEDIQLGRQQIGLDESLVKIPGLFMQNRFNFDQDLRISIRGFGARAGFGIRGIKILVDGIPETLPDGQGQVDNIDLGSAERIEVIRGPTSSLYGNASGGVISVFTEDGPSEPFIETRVSLGQDDFQKHQLKAGGQLGSMNYLVNLSRMQFDGFREHSRAENVQLNGRFHFDLSETSELTTLVNFADSPIAKDPGALTRAQAQSDPRQAAGGNVEFDSGEKITQTRLGLVYRRRFEEDRELTATTYTTFRDFAKNLPFRVGGATDFDRLVLGGGVKYTHVGRIHGKRHRLTMGIDVEHQNDDRRRFDNHGGQRGELDLHQVEEVSGVGPFVQDELSVLENLELTLGARYDRVRFDVEDLFLSDGNDTGGRSLDALSPMIGLRYSRSPIFTLYGNISTSFETPTTAELFNPSGQGGFNPRLEPQRATNYEVGIKGDRQTLRYEIAVFTIRVKDELIPFELPESPGRTFYKNAGQSTRNGIELGLAVRPMGGLTLSLAYTYSDFFFEEFRVEDGVFDGNRIPGIPGNQIYAEAAYFHPSGAYGVWDVQFVGELFLDNANTATADSYTVSNLRLGYEGRIGNWGVSPFIGLNNLSDETYNANVRVNAFGGRYFEPAPGLTLYGGLSLSYSF